MEETTIIIFGLTGIILIGFNILFAIELLKKNLKCADVIRNTIKYTSINESFSARFGRNSLSDFEKVAEEYKKLNFNKNQIFQIYEGLRNGLKFHQILTYLKKEFDAMQMEIIRSANELGLSPREISIIAHPKFDWRQMYQISLGFLNKLDIEQVSVYAKSELGYKEMEILRISLEHGRSIEEVTLYAKPGFNYGQILQIQIGFRYNLSIKKIMLYAKTTLDKDQMIEIRRGLMEGLPFEQVSSYAKEEYPWHMMSDMRVELEKKMYEENHNPLLDLVQGEGIFIENKSTLVQKWILFDYIKEDLMHCYWMEYDQLCDGFLKTSDYTISSSEFVLNYDRFKAIQNFHLDCIQSIK